MVSSAERVPRHTAAGINRQIRAEMEDRIGHFAAHPGAIPARLRQLDREWDIERMIEANASTLAFTGVMLGLLHDRRWLALPAMVTAFLFQHAVQGWCPPVPVLRRMGFRTPDEINQERYALKAIRGDFRGVGRGRSGKRAAVRAVG